MLAPCGVGVNPLSTKACTLWDRAPQGASLGTEANVMGQMSSQKFKGLQAFR